MVLHCLEQVSQQGWDQQVTLLHAPSDAGLGFRNLEGSGTGTRETRTAWPGQAERACQAKNSSGSIRKAQAVPFERSSKSTDIRIRCRATSEIDRPDGTTPFAQSVTAESDILLHASVREA